MSGRVSPVLTAAPPPDGGWPPDGARDDARPAVAGSASPKWRLMSPAPRVAALELGGSVPRVRRLVLKQVRESESTAIYRGGELIALAMFARHGWRRTEMALGLTPAARKHMRRLVRMAQLTLGRLAETRLIVVDINPANQTGQRMAALTGFRPARLKSKSAWIYRSERDGITVRRRQGEGRGGQGGSAVAPAATGR